MGLASSVLRHRPSPALVVAIVALVVAMSGTGYAALREPDHSVGTAQLQRGAVRSAQVRDHSLLARDFRAGQLPRGRTGARGARGPTGSAGRQGPPGQKGDTGTVDASRFYDKTQSDARFVPAGQVTFGQAVWDSSTSDTILSIPELYGMTIRTTGAAERQLLVQTDSSEVSGPTGVHEICIFADGADPTLGNGSYCRVFTSGLSVGYGGGASDVGTVVPYTVVFTVADEPMLSVKLTCTFQDLSGSPRYVRCYAERSAPQ
jgi:hypothetical protein